MLFKQIARMRDKLPEFNTDIEKLQTDFLHYKKKKGHINVLEMVSIFYKISNSISIRISIYFKTSLKKFSYL